jgi:hypothetical protein
MTKFLIGVATAALWFALSHAANAERICRQVCDAKSALTAPAFRVASSARIQKFMREREHSRHDDRSFDADALAGDIVIHR